MQRHRRSEPSDARVAGTQRQKAAEIAERGGDASRFRVFEAACRQRRFARRQMRRTRQVCREEIGVDRSAGFRRHDQAPMPETGDPLHG